MTAARSRGFTLLEILVVMTVIGLVAALVAPNLQKLVGGVERSTQRDGVLAEVASLSYRAYVLGQSFELSDESPSTVLQDGNPIVALPSGWRLHVDAPVLYSFNGLCGGGRVTVLAPDAPPETLELAAPDCRIARNGK